MSILYKIGGQSITIILPAHTKTASYKRKGDKKMKTNKEKTNAAKKAAQKTVRAYRKADSAFDPTGSYTGVTNKSTSPVQDADDL